MLKNYYILIYNKIGLKYLNFRLRKYYFKIANSKEKNDTYKLRYTVFCKELNYIPIGSCQNDKEIDEYDKNAVVFVALNNKKEVIGTIRVILSNLQKIPSAGYVNLEKYLQSKGITAELSRFIVNKKFRNKIVSLGLIKIAIMYAFSKNISNFVITCPVAHAIRYKQMGFKEITKPYMYLGVNNDQPSITLINNIKENQQLLKHSNPFFYEFLNMNNKTIKIDA